MVNRGISGMICPRQRPWLPGERGNKYRDKSSGFHQEIHVDLDPKDIGSVWRNCEQRLDTEIRRGGRLCAFMRFQFFINSKGYKHRMRADEFSKLMMIYKDKVRHCFNFC
jgi:hypothetical protein